ncbi:uncharacterized protein LOC127094751 [Lathyrus oleraceus]|uniref:uncharacterized protein LOC127094751 n=1 Tax=Pisum sativum TaxID=3888 RepID=UPI0021CF52EA|nr:uncharacterized protein LOC127094751 [Pisum sativum]
MKYLPNSLTKNDFTWFTTLPPHSVQSWSKLERLFHEQFYMGKSKISLKELASFRRKFPESIDNYLNRFRLLKAMCFTQVPEHELVEMAVSGLDYSIRKKLDTQYLRDMAQLVDRVRQVEHLKAGKSRTNKYHKKEKVTYIEEDDYISDVGDDCSEEGEVSMAELKPGPPYMCKLLKPLNRKNPVETSNNDKFATRIYTFDITKCDEIFKLLVADGQIGLVQKAMKDGRLQFGENPKSLMKVDSDPKKTEDANYTKPMEILMVEAAEGSNLEVNKGEQISAISDSNVQPVYP